MTAPLNAYLLAPCVASFVDPCYQLRVNYRALLFDLFRTVVLLRPEAPTMRVTEPSWRAAMQALRGPMEEALPGLAFDAFLDALFAVTGDIMRQRPPEYYEVSVRERYRRAFIRVGLDPSVAEAMADRFSLLQTRQLVIHSELPAVHLMLLHQLATRYRLGLVSNFDHAPTVREVLSRHGIGDLFAVTLISDEFGRRKPHPEIFREALRRLGATAGEALYIGDSFAEDVRGPAAIGIDTAWINPAAVVPPADSLRPRYLLSTLTDLASVLDPTGNSSA
jgi:HAD superfamily hydrolase (TIGR01549 family)